MCFLQDYIAVFLCLYITKLIEVLPFPSLVSLFYLSDIYFFPNFLKPLNDQQNSECKPTSNDYMERSVYRIYTLFCLALCYVVTFIKNKNKQKNEETRCFWTFYFLWMNTPYLCFMHCMAELFPLKFHVQINYVMLNINFSPKYSSHPNLCQA